MNFGDLTGEPAAHQILDAAVPSIAQDADTLAEVDRIRPGPKSYAWCPPIQNQQKETT